MLVYDAIYIGLTSSKTLVALIMVVFIVTIFFFDLWVDFVRFVIDQFTKVLKLYKHNAYIQRIAFEQGRGHLVTKL